MKKHILGFILSLTIFSCQILEANASESCIPDPNLTYVSDFIDASSTAAMEIVDTSNHIYSYNEMTVDIALLQERYPNYISFNSLGISVDNRTVWQITVGNPNAPKAIYVQAGIHGREWMNCWLVMKQIENICINYNVDLFNKICLCIVPMVNPDGVTISQYGISAINNKSLRTKLYRMPGASTPSRWKANANGVDLNRNFSVGWNSIINSYTPCSENYNGTSSFSEPEVVAVLNAFNARKFEVAITYHSMEGAIYWNVGQKGELFDKTALLANQVSKITGYKLSPQSVIHGLDYNWMIFNQQTPTVLIETGTVACPLPYSQWNELWRRNCDLLSQLAILYY